MGYVSTLCGIVPQKVASCPVGWLVLIVSSYSIWSKAGESFGLGRSNQSDTGFGRGGMLRTATRRPPEGPTAMTPKVVVPARRPWGSLPKSLYYEYVARQVPVLPARFSSPATIRYDIVKTCPVESTGPARSSYAATVHILVPSVSGCSGRLSMCVLPRPLVGRNVAPFPGTQRLGRRHGPSNARDMDRRRLSLASQAAGHGLLLAGGLG